MKVKLPEFRENEHWRRIPPSERNGKPWKYVLLQDVFLGVETGVDRRYECRSGGRLWMVILPYGIWIMEGYAWNGNSFSPDWILGVCLLFQSLPHDGLFQFSGAFGFPRAIITLRWVNWLYLKTAHPFWGKVYYAGLVSGSWAFWACPPKNGEYVESLPLPQPEPT
jgi:hypothetical protein